MEQRHIGPRLCGSLFGSVLLCLCLVPAAWAQQTMGTVSVTVVDTTGGVIPGAQLKLTDLATNDIRTAITQEAGNYTFVNLDLGQYKLTASLEGFDTQSLDVLVQSARTTDVKVTLTVGAAGQPYFLPPDWVAQIKADGTIASNDLPGTWGDIFYLHGPHQTFTDIGISKAVPLTGGIRFKFQVEMLNAFNHPVFEQSTVALTNSGFGRGRLMPNTTSRRIEFRGNLEF